MWNDKNRKAGTKGYAGRAAAPAGVPSPRSIGSNLTCRISRKWNTETPVKSVKTVSRPQGKLKSSKGTGRVKKRMPSVERQQEHITGWIGQYLNRKVADVTLVLCPKNDAGKANQGES